MLPPARSREQPHVAHDQHGFLRPGAASSGNSNRAGHRVDHVSEKAISDGHKLLYGCVGPAYSPPSSATPREGLQRRVPPLGAALVSTKMQTYRVRLMIPSRPPKV